MKFAHVQQDPIRGAQPQIASRDVARITLEMHFSVRGPRDGISEVFQLTADNSFESKRGGRNQIESGHCGAHYRIRAGIGNGKPASVRLL
jgi:hypothetical protein